MRGRDESVRRPIPFQRGGKRRRRERRQRHERRSSHQRRVGDKKAESVGEWRRTHHAVAGFQIEHRQTLPRIGEQ